MRCVARLLSSIEGAAVTAVRIEGVLHEFQSITGVVEDATDIILNLKQIPFKLNGEGPKALYLRADAAGVITFGLRSKLIRTLRFWIRMFTSARSPKADALTWRCV